jgi:hypothetical protein
MSKGLLSGLRFMVTLNLPRLFGARLGVLLEHFQRQRFNSSYGVHANDLGAV